MLRGLLEPLDNRTKACTNAGCQDLLEFNISDALPFFTFTTTLLKTKDITVHIIFSIYNKLFSYLERSIAQLAQKKRYKISFTSFLLRSGSHASAYNTTRVLRITLCPTNSNIQTHSPYLMATLWQIRSLILICLSHQLHPFSHRQTPTLFWKD
ncbi:hypothetical protein GB937_010781 [Aspergillus fischeri]|nr:hypothetical protein GB937_010781 [Aspergillus fischeri]